MYGAEWDGERVRERLVLAFRLAPGIAVYSPRKDVLISIAEQGPIDGLMLMVMVGHALDRFRCERLLSWARARAQGVSTAAWCEERAWSRVTLYNASSDVAKYLNCRYVADQATALTTATFVVA